MLYDAAYALWRDWYVIRSFSKCHGIDNRQYQVSRDLATRGVFKSTTILFLTRLLTAS